MGDAFAREVEQDGGELVAVEVEADRVTRLGDEPQHGGRLAARGGPAPGVGGQALGAQPGGDLADRLGGQAGPVRQLQAADPLAARRAQQVEHERRVVEAQRGKVRPAHARPRARTCAFVRPRTCTRARPRTRPHARTPVRPHPPIVPRACTFATALPKWVP
ncbi:hypothetical protein GCM10019017_51130 [Streptomyces showdoensis]